MLMCPSAFLVSLKFSEKSQNSEKKNNSGMASEEIPKWPCRHQCGGPLLYAGGKWAEKCKPKRMSRMEAALFWLPWNSLRAAEPRNGW